jgi:hypothetical protein
MNDTQLGDLLRGLPRTNASPAFDSELRRKLRAAREPQPRFTWRTAVQGWRMAAFAMALVLLVAVNAGIAQHARQERFAAMRAEQQKLRAELESVKEGANAPEPVVVLENDRGSRVIVDADSAAARNPDIQPVAYRTFD